MKPALDRHASTGRSPRTVVARSLAAAGLLAAVVALVGCAAPTAPSDGGTPTDTAAGLPTLHPADPARAARGEALLTGRMLGRGVVPRLALRNLWIAWGDATPGTDATYWPRFRARYGLFPAPYENDGYPMGLHAVDAAMATFDCLLCHATVTAGRTLVGAGNSQLDLQGLHDDLVRLNELAPMYGFPSYPLPFTFTDRTGAAGANDAFGLGMEFSTRYGPAGAGVHTRFGSQQPPAWWTLRARNRAYTDGAGEVGGYRLMMATLLAFGYRLDELQAMDDRFADLAQYVLSVPAPRWELGPIDPAARARGATVFAARCADCHGTYDGASAGFPDRVVPVGEVGTDPLRAAQFTDVEAAWVNASWFGQDHPMRATQGYLAPPLTGVWATAPYFHNGSVPDLAGVLDSRLRPARWERVGADAASYDPVRVGWRVRDGAAGTDRTTLAGRRVYDTALAGLAGAGHTYGDALTDAERADLLEYLKSL